MVVLFFFCPFQMYVTWRSIALFFFVKNYFLARNEAREKNNEPISEKARAHWWINDETTTRPRPFVDVGMRSPSEAPFKVENRGTLRREILYTDQVGRYCVPHTPRVWAGLVVPVRLFFLFFVFCFLLFRPFSFFIFYFLFLFLFFVFYFWSKFKIVQI
jgi:hypothetical protein